MALNLVTRHGFIAQIFRKIRLRMISFGPLSISERMSCYFTEKKIMHPTEIQEKAMLPILQGRNVILNSETGSGKTLCYLLPILQQLKQSQKTFQNKIISSSCALIFAPTLELADQIGSVLKELGQTDINIACGNSPLRVKDSTQVIITVPSFIMNYDWKSIRNIRCVVFDEADSMMVERFDEIRNILEFYTGRKRYFSRRERARQKKKESRRKYEFSKAEEVPQFVFVGATIPSGGKKTALSLIEKFVPSSRLIQTSKSHKVIERTKFEFVDVMDDVDAKVGTLATVLERELAAKRAEFEKNKDEVTSLESERLSRFNNFRAIVYVNKLSDVQTLFEKLTKNDRKIVQNSKYIYKYDNQSEIGPESETRSQLAKYDDVVFGDYASFSDANIRAFRGKWKNKFCMLHGSMLASERLSVMDGFAKGVYNVLVTTNIASRGLDIPNVDLIVQFDFATNVAAVVHRAGRTARAGAEGKVVSFVAEKDKDLCHLFRSTLDANEDVSRLFSRRRRLRQRIKRGSLKTIDLLNG